GSTARLQAISAVTNYSPSESSFNFVDTPTSEIFGANVFSAKVMKERLPRDTYKSIMKTIQGGEKLDSSVADVVASSMKDWAIEKGATHYTHVFYPLTGSTAEKHDSFLAPDGNGSAMAEFSGAQLIQGEPDASSFPSGGLRATFEARGYTAWDPTSPAFIIENPKGSYLAIPTPFASWTGEALDQKTPLLRSSDAVNKHALRMLRHLGDTQTNKVFSNVGWEQEFFVVPREHYLARPDLVATGRTLFGQKPLRGQEQSTNYFGRMPVVIRAYLDEARDVMWSMGISIDCVHNEVAPAQYEISPIFSLVNLAADTNVLAMDVLRDLAYEHDLMVLFHEKPFAGINGTGKHNNWGLNTDTGDNLFVPGETPAENRRFVAFLAAVLRGVNKHGDLLRCGVSTSWNDHRLGAQEAPPPIITVHLGKSLEKHLKGIAAGGELSGYGLHDKLIQVATSVVDIEANLEDRNRTAPFPWCGNRFEFRSIGGNQHIAFPLALVNTVVAEGLKHMCDQMDSGAGVDQVIRETIKANQGVLFSGDGYSSALYEHAEEHDLFHLENSPDAYECLTSTKNLKLFSELGVFSEKEARARQNVLLEAYATDLQIEARTLIHMMQTLIVPAVLQDIQNIAASGFTSRALTTRRELAQSLFDELDSLIEAFDGAAIDDPMEAARYAQDVLKPRLLAAREVIDPLEGMVDSRLWPVPTYDELL
ncbi:MAG: glutamine synthetase III, partial [Gemmatimonadetes bacterium]|nr:glutamine synthetase III [Gemmatimonadota bacterium]